MTVTSIRRELRHLHNPGRARISPRFFKTGLDNLTDDIGIVANVHRVCHIFIHPGTRMPS